MRTGAAALLISLDESVLRSLQQALESLDIQSDIARSYEQARLVLEGMNSPEVVFCDTFLPDATWAEVITTATQAEKRAHVIVVSQVVDYKLYADALKAGAADFLVPPFLPLNVSFALNKIRECEVSKKRDTRSYL